MGSVVAFDTVIEHADGRPTEFGVQFKFHEVFWEEIALINQRRARDPRGENQTPNRSSGRYVR
jgi:hypothetical protein